MKLDQLLEQMLAQKCADANNHSTSIGGTIEAISDAEKSEQPDSSSKDVTNGNGNLMLSDQSDEKPFGQEKSAHQANGIQNQQQLNIISAFLKANPLPNFSMFSKMPAERPIVLSSANSTPNTSLTNSPTKLVPFSQDVASQGLMAIGGCRQCSKTFMDRLSLIHHFIDHFPNIFYSFEERPAASSESNKSSPSKNAQNGAAESSSGTKLNANGKTIAPPAELLGQLAALVGNNPSNMPIPPAVAHFPVHQETSNAVFGAATVEPPFGANFFNAFIRGNNGQQLVSNVVTKAPPPVKHSHAKKRQNVQQENGENAVDQQKPVSKKASNGTSKVPNMPSLSELPYHMCPHCCLTFAETAAYKAHLAMHESELNLASAVSASIAPFLGMSSTESSPLKCPLCEMKFSSGFRLNEHMRLHSAHSCEICQKTFMTAFDLNLHMGTHTGFTYDCKDCGKCFPCRKTLAEHNRSHRMVLSNGGSGIGNTSPELGALAMNGNGRKANGSNGPMPQQQMDSENAPFLGLFDVQQQQQIVDQNGRDRRKIRVPRKGEKSRRSATLVAYESRTPPVAPPTGEAMQVTPPASVQFWPPKVGNESASANMSENVIGFSPLMGQLLMRANCMLAEQKAAKNEGSESFGEEKCGEETQSIDSDK